MASGVSTFLEDAAGSIVAFEPTAGTDAGTVVRFAPGQTTPELSWQNVSHVAEDGAGTVWMLSGNVLSHFAPGSSTPMFSLPNIDAFVVDAAGSVVVVQDLPELAGQVALLTKNIRRFALVLCQVSILG